MPSPASERSAVDKPRILVVEDDEAMRALVAITLRHAGYEVVEAKSGIELFEAIRRFGVALLRGEYEPLDLIITDIRMPGLSAFEVLELIGDAAWPIPVVVVTAFGDDATHARARALGAKVVLDKPFDMDRLLETVHCLVPEPPDAPRETKRRRSPPPSS